MSESTGKVRSLLFESDVTPPPRGITRVQLGPLRLPASLAKMAIHLVPEKLFLAMAAKYAGDVELAELFKRAYKEIAKDKAFRGVRSAIPYCLGGVKHGKGRAFVYQPCTIEPNTPVVVCMHGYGGNFLFYPWALLAGLRDHVVVCPCWAEHYDHGDVADIHRYIENCLERVREDLGLASAPSWLIAVSGAGGDVGPLVVDGHVGSYRGYVSLSSSVGTRLKNHGQYPMLILHGTEDPCFALSTLNSDVNALRSAGSRITVKTWDANHWLLLSHREEVGRALRAFMGLSGV